MGLFDFFKGKPKNKIDAAKPFSENQTLVLTAMNMLLGDKTVQEVRATLKDKGLEEQQIELILAQAIGMNEKHFQKPPATDTAEINSMHPANEMSANSKPKTINELYAPGEEKRDENELQIINVTERGHGDNYGGLLGFDTLQNADQANALISQLVHIAVGSPGVEDNPVYKVCEADFTSKGGNDPNLRIRVLYINRAGQNSNTVLSSFPYIHAGKILPFKTKRICEWSDSAKLEADIEGGGRDTFGLGFFATDYAINKQKYKANKELNIKISGIAFVLDESSITEISGTKVHPDFCTYIPSKDFPAKSYYDFVGKLLDFRKVTLTGDLCGYMLLVKLINHDTIDDFFTVDVFVNELNMRIKDLEKGMKVTGLLWLQGEIA